MKFDFEPWELPGQHTTPGEMFGTGFQCYGVSLENELFEVWATRILYDHILGFRRLSSPHLHYMFAHFSEEENTSSPQFITINLSDGAEVESILRNQFKKSISQNNWGRYFHFCGDFSPIESESQRPLSTWGCFILSSGLGRLEHLNYKHHHIRHARFQLSPSQTTEALNLVSAAEIGNWFDGQLTDKSSEMSQARNFALLSKEQALDFCLQWKYGDREEYQKVIHWIVQSQLDFWPIEGKSIGWAIFQDVIPTRDLTPHVNRLYRRTIDLDVGKEVPAIVIERLQLIRDYFQPHIAAHLANQILIQDWLENKYLARLQVNTQNLSPTAHEQIEAAVSLRQWAQDKFSPAEIELLCD